MNELISKILGVIASAAVTVVIFATLISKTL